MITIILSDNLPCEIKTLPLYALDHIGPQDPGEFTYWIKTLSGEMEQPYNLAARLENPPSEPDKDDDDTWKLTEWERYQAAIVHNRKRHELAEIRAGNVAQEILRRCLKPEDRDRIVTAEDYQTVYLASIAQEVSEEALADSLRDFFRGSIREQGDFSGIRVLWLDRQGRPDRVPRLSSMGSGTDAEDGPDAGGLLTDTDDRKSAADMRDETARLDGSSATRKETPGTQTMIASLIMCEARHGRVYHPSMQQWLFYYAAIEYANQLEAAKVARLFVLKKALELQRSMMEQIAGRAAETAPEHQAALLKQAKELHKQMRKNSRELIYLTKQL